MPRESAAVKIKPGCSPLHEVRLRLQINRLPSEVTKAYRRGWSVKSGAVSLAVFRTGSVGIRGGSQAERDAVRAALTPRDWAREDSESRKASAAEPATAAFAIDESNSTVPW